ncbi:hypothetical protein [Aliarcobacter cryaerophilus]|jgi:hypothetical protein|uniref:hypothetical protein n=1 Tax=Aliarcobacter cryaerophilus TaxID=28198 RepID=UPI0021B273F0|nr:hypothetical protein [Aliarcobacter cryaerophilus]MCT7484558.1 hypothetical protein [Aliarcobacter cryaerophilus]
MNNNCYIENLKKTLTYAGINDIKITEGMIKSYGFLEKDRKNVHNQTNNLLKSSLDKNSLGECIHITGEMRALTDPFHRYLCDQINLKDKDVFKVVYNHPDIEMNNTVDMLKWNLKKWTSKNKKRIWQEELKTIYSIANRSVSLYALDTSNEIQYSVFGYKYILLQEKHDDLATQKHTWLLESESLNAELTLKAENYIKKAKKLEEGNYRKFTQDLNNVSSQRFLSLLSKSEKSIIELLEDKLAMDFTDSTQEILDTLRVMNFLNINDNKVSITESGREFIG